MTASSPLSTLFLPFEQDLLSWAPQTLFMGADWHEMPGSCDLWQPFKPASNRLVAHGLFPFEVLPQDKKYDLVIAHLPKQVDEAKFWIAQGLRLLNAGGALVVSAANDAGGTRLVKWFAEAGFENVQSHSKNKARVVWAVKTPQNEAATISWWEKGNMRLADFGNGDSFYTQPGLFSWDRVDFASRLLIETLPDLKGAVADFGCGYGYLSHSVLKNNPGITSLTMVDADARAIACAQKNIEGVKGNKEIVSCWHDATKPVPCAQPFNFIVMNPPFHVGKMTDTDLGQAMIGIAASHLKKGGVLYMVANTHLPYEKISADLFKNVTIVTQKSGFKIMKAVK